MYYPVVQMINVQMGPKLYNTISTSTVVVVRSRH